LVVYLALVGIALWLTNKKLNIDRVTFQDGCFYEEGGDLDDYFVKRVDTGNKVVQQGVSNNDNLNSTRNLKNDIDYSPQRDTQVDNIMILTINANNKEKNEPVQDDPTKITSDSLETIKYKKITYNDYSKIPADRLVEYDKRSLIRYLNDELIHNHCVLKIFLKHSLLDTRLYTSLQLILKINLMFGLNALAITDNMIEARSVNPLRVYSPII
jgi:hypothetical protein